MALHRAERNEPFADERTWHEALLSLTPEHPDGTAWCMIAPLDRPAFMQAPVPGGSLDDWANDRPTPDSLDILVTSKNHDLKRERQSNAQVDDWIFALVNLQTAAPYPGSGNYGISRMNGGSSSCPGLGVEPTGGPGQRWLRDLRIGLEERPFLVETHGYRETGGTGLLWLSPWDGKSALGFAALDPFYIEISRRLRLVEEQGRVVARRTSSAGPRILKAEANSRKGNTGDLWTPVERKSGKSLGVSAIGFH
jgi:CRISPR system Cascade subunit CasA